ncbi:GreA/GreB family elongation factor [Croceivirga radicis]|uniref:GreA/GreB family elongation factor n=1 Tax=Croceivirga radicis TaxID=1929488 RepID=UPI000255B430|nr:GreA/GreB family elongation factor [Croceivirga radicis]
MIKGELLAYCKQFVRGKLQNLNNRIQEVNQALLSETKSTAGDKHETGRAMVQLEREKLGSQLAELEKMEKVLARISETPNTIGALGSLVVTDKATYYLSISVGQYKGEKHTVYCISTASPIGKLLLGKKAGDCIEFNGKPITIKTIY